MLIKLCCSFFLPGKYSVNQCVAEMHYNRPKEFTICGQCMAHV